MDTNDTNDTGNPVFKPLFEKFNNYWNIIYSKSNRKDTPERTARRLIELSS
jgi:hypothetical protein